MLYKSGINLFSGAHDFMSKSNEINLFCAYVRTEQLKVLNKENKLKQIVVRWEIRDLHQGASDLDLYKYCRDNDIVLYRNTRIHLKCMVNENADIFLGSANITRRGVGEADSNFNYELNAIKKEVDFIDTFYLDKIISQSQFVSDELFNEIKEKVESLVDFKKQEIEYNEKEVKGEKMEKDFFLISQLPTFKKVELLYEAAKNASVLTPLEKKCVSHDLAIYDINIDQAKEDFYKSLGKSFNKHPFIVSFKEKIVSNSRRSLNYGSVVKWITKKTTTVPSPISWELKKEQVVNTLYSWVCFFDQNFMVEKPNYSEVIRYKGT